MLVINAERRSDFDYKKYVKRSAVAEDFSRLVKEDCLVSLGTESVIKYKDVSNWVELTKLVEVLKELRYDTHERTGGLKTTSRVFGYQPRITLRKDYCSATSLQSQEQNVARVLEDVAKLVAKEYAESFGSVYNEHFQLANEKVLPEWRIKDTPFTSGIINKNNPLKYHFDSGNFKNVCSCMLAFKYEVGGGYLSCPEFDLGFEIKDCSLLIFDGQSILHGVTPIKKLSENAYRFTVVFYSLKQMWKCEPLELEVARIRNLKTKREQKRAGVAQ